MKKNETLMNYNQWKKLYKHSLKKKIRNGLQWLLFGLFMAAVPVGMIMHWLMYGY